MKKSLLSQLLSNFYLLGNISEEKMPKVNVVFLSLLVALSCGLSDILILFFGDWQHLYGVLGVPVQRWEEIVIYAPFGKAFSVHNLCPLAPAFDKTLQGLSIFPCITIFLVGILYKVVSIGSIDVYILLSHTVLPVVAFWLMYLVFRLFIPRSWAVLMAFLGVMHYPGLSYLGVLKAFFESPSSFLYLHYSLPEITRTPFPNIGLAGFLVPLYLTLRVRRLDLRVLSILSVLWALQIYIYPFNFIAGVPLFIFWVPYASYITYRRFDSGKVFGSLGISLLIIILVALPFLVVYQTETSLEMASKVFVLSDTGLLITDWGIVKAYVLPFMALIATFFVFRADYYELFFKFTPVFIMVGIDLLMGIFHFFVGSWMNSQLYFYRISNFVFRFMYFVPFLYFISLPTKPLPSKHTQLLEGIRQKTCLWMHRCIYQLRKWYALIGILIIGTYATANGIHIFFLHENLVSPQMQEISRQINLTNQKISPGSIVVYEDITPNLVGPALTDNTSLLVSSFWNFVPEKSILERLLLYAALFGWSEDRLAAFITPSEFFLNLNSFHGQCNTMAPEILEKNLGYWLLHHQKKMLPAEFDHYLNEVLKLYRAVDIKELLRRNPISVIVARNVDNYPLNSFKQERKGEYVLVYPTVEVEP